jgi:hypothetical protein
MPPMVPMLSRPCRDAEIASASRFTGAHAGGFVLTRDLLPGPHEQSIGGIGAIGDIIMTPPMPPMVPMLHAPASIEKELPDRFAGHPWT